MSFFRILSISTAIVPFILLFGIIKGLQYYRYLKTDYKLLVVYLIGCFLADISSRIMGEFYKNNLICMVAFSLFELLFFVYYYQTCFFKRKVWRYLIVALIGTIYIGHEIYTLINVKPEYFQTYSKTFTAFLIIIMGIDFFIENLKEERIDSSSTMRRNAIFIFYFSLNLILFLPINFLINVSSSVKFYFWLINLIVTFSFYIILTKKIWKNGLTQKQLQRG